MLFFVSLFQAKWAAIAVFLVACVILVTAAPSNLYEDEEEFMEPAAAEQQEAYADGKNIIQNP